MSGIEIIHMSTDIVIVGGGTAGCFAATAIREQSPETDVLVVEKAHIKRSGCLAAGVNAINAYLNPGETPETFLAYVKQDSGGLVRDDLVLSIAENLNRVTAKLESWGVPFLKTEDGRYKPRGRRNVEMIGEAVKPLLAAAVERSGARILNRTVATNYMIENSRAVGIYAFSARERKFYVIRAKAVICAAGGAAGIYKPNNEGSARHKMWYCPFNVGTGFAMGLRAGAEMTTFEMRFIALRVKDVISPTGTIAQGVKARAVNALGETYLDRYSDRTTPMRTYAVIREHMEGRGPCFLDFTHIDPAENRTLKERYLCMSPGMVLKWADEGIEPKDKPVEVCGTEPYLVGGHGQAGYWVDVRRKTTLPGVFAAGDVVGGAPKKYVTGCFCEGEIAGLAALEYIKNGLNEAEEEKDTCYLPELMRVFAYLERADGIGPDAYEERLQKIMDEYAGGITSQYLLFEPKLLIARELLQQLQKDIEQNLAAGDMYELVKAHSITDRVLVARVLVEHLLYRKETRWKAYQERTDYPQRDDLSWLKFVNSVYDHKTGKITVIERPCQEVKRT